MAEFTHDDIKNRIRDILRADTVNLFDATGEGTKTRLVEIETGWPNDARVVPKGRKFPFAFITNGTPFESMKITGSVVADAIKSLEHITNYMIVIGVRHENSKAAELQLDTFQRLILNDLETDVQLKNGGTPLVDQCTPIRVEPFRPELQGTNMQMRAITLKVTKTSDQ